MPVPARSLPARRVDTVVGPVLRARSEKRDRILAAATQVFARHGFFAAQVADIAREAGVAAGTVYLYFRSKDDLLISIFERTMRTAIDEGRRVLTQEATPEEHLRRIARLHLSRLGSDRDLAIVFQIELRHTTKFMERFSTTHLREYLGVIRDVISAGQQTGAFSPALNPTVAAKVFFGALDEMATDWVLSRRRYDLEAQADVVVDLVVNGFAPGTRRVPAAS